MKSGKAGYDEIMIAGFSVMCYINRGCSCSQLRGLQQNIFV